MKPLLKKNGADHELFSNFCPVSNLYEGLLEEFQSAYKSHHSTETALARVQNHILMAIDKNRSVILLLLDLSAAESSKKRLPYGYHSSMSRRTRRMYS